MSELNETPETPAPVEGQPEVQAVEPASVEVPAPETAEEAPVTLEPRLFAGKYKTVEELEASYQSTSSEASRMASELAATRRTTAPAKTDEKPKYNQEQLETWKEARLREVTQNQIRAERFSAEGNFQEAQRHDAAAGEAVRQIRMIDAELRQLDIKTALQSTNRSSAEQTMLADAAMIINQHKADLVPGTTLYDKASGFLSGYGAMGLDTENPLVQAQAVAMAAQVLGLSSKKVAQTTRKELTQTIQSNLKAATVSGGGKSVKASAGPNFDTMSDKEFADYKRARGWD